MAAPISTLHTVCSECGAVYEREHARASCIICRPPRPRTANRIASEERRGTPKSQGYGAAWRRLSRRARRLQPFCSDCGRTDELTADHSPEAWERQQQGLPIRLEDIDVVCKGCNSERGPARGPDAVPRETIGSRSAALTELEDDMPDDLDQRIARGELE